jgi:DNA end-binding protein Ku
MARAIWSGSISFGLVSVPVKAFSAVRDHSVHFNQLEKKTGARINYKKVSDKTGKEVTADDIESGYEIASGKYVVVDDEELEKLRPRTSRTIDIADFVNLAEIDPIYYERTYWLGPDGEAAERPYRLLRAAMEEEAKAGIGTVVMRKKQYLAAIRPLDGALAMSTMRFADEVVPQEDIDALPGKGAKPEPKELKLASQIIGSLATDWDPQRYHDTYTEELKSLIEAKAKGKEIVIEEEAPAESNVLDLMQALEASLEAARKGGGKKMASEVAKLADELVEEADDDAGDTDDEKPKSRAKKAPAKKSGPKKAASKRKPAKAGTRKSA